MPAYRVALCEDEAAERGQIAGLCRDIFAALGVGAEIVPFPSADALLASEAGGAAFDLYLLDIQMAGTTGLELARQLYRRGVRDRIIFLTGSAEHAIPGYDVEPLHYLLKPVDRARLEQALRRALEKRGMGPSCSSGAARRCLSRPGPSAIWRAGTTAWWPTWRTASASSPCR